MSKPCNVATRFIGIKGKRICNDSFAGSANEVWDHIFYRVEHAQAQYSREQAPRMLGKQGWRVIEVTVVLPPLFQVSEDGETLL